MIYLILYSIAGLITATVVILDTWYPWGWCRENPLIIGFCALIFASVWPGVIACALLGKLIQHLADRK